MRVAIHQPNYIPWAGYFYKMFYCDRFIFLDDVQYSKNSFINRNRVKNSNGEMWLTIPVKSKIENNINEVYFAQGNWRKKHIKTIETNYKKAPYFKDYSEKLFELILQPTENLATFNINLLKEIAKWLEVPCEFILSSEIGSEKQGDERLIDLILKIKGTLYLSGYGGANYQEESKFEQYGLRMEYYKFKPPVYPQLWGEFIPGLSIIDLLFNVGPESKKLIVK